MTGYKLPDFDELPAVEGMPQGCAWGVFDADGKKDVFGTINLLTPDVVTAAASEVVEGISVSLKYVFSVLWFGVTSLTRRVLAGRLVQLRTLHSSARAWSIRSSTLETRLCLCTDSMMRCVY